MTFQMESDIKAVKTKKFWGNLYKKTTEKGIPLTASFELTYQCNLSCCHCYIPRRQTTGDRRPSYANPSSAVALLRRVEATEGRQREGVRGKNQEELSYSEICSILDQLAEMGCFHLNLTGGEMFVRPDTLEIVDYAKKKGFYLNILTNGTLITPDIADRLKDFGINQVDISLYGMTEKTYESITRVPGSFQRCLQGINLLHERNIPICIKMTVLTLNIEEFARVKAFARKLKVRFQWGYFIQPRIDGSGEPLKFRISAEQGINLEIINQPDLFEEEKIRKGKKDVFSKRDGLFYCNAGRNSLAITPYGEMNLCLEYHFPQYDLRKGSVAEGWKELGNYVKLAKPSKNYRCKNCGLREFCQWCPAEGWLNKGDRNACIPFFKELALAKKTRNRR